MLVSLDHAGRVVIPEDVRDLLGLDPSVELVLEVVGDELRLRRRPPAARRVVDVDGWPTLEAVGDRPLTDADVRARRDADQR